jgi:hypothetical protein
MAEASKRAANVKEWRRQANDWIYRRTCNDPTLRWGTDKFGRTHQRTPEVIQREEKALIEEGDRLSKEYEVVRRRLLGIQGKRVVAQTAADAVVTHVKELRASWQKIQRLQVKEFRALALNTEDLEPGLKEDRERAKFRSRRSVKREQREAVYAAEQRSRSSTEFRPEREDLNQGEGEYADSRHTDLKVELRAQGDQDGQADRRGPPTDRPPDP